MMKKLVMIACAVASAVVFAAEAVEWLEDQDLYEFCLMNEPNPGIRTTQMRKSAAETPLRMNGFTYEHGIGMHAFPGKTMTGDFFPGGKGKRFEVKFGIDDRSGENAAATSNLYADEKLVATSGIVRKGEPVKEMSVDLKGVLVLSIELKDNWLGLSPGRCISL